MNKYIVNIFLTLSTLMAQNERIDISNFYEPTYGYNFFTFDPSYSTSFVTNIYNPNNLDDIKFYDIIIDSSPMISVGNYIISSLVNNFSNDTISSTAFDHNRGDYTFSENTIFFNNNNFWNE